MRMVEWRSGLPAFALALAAFSGGAFAQSDYCANISERYEDALTRMTMIEARSALLLMSTDETVRQSDIATRIMNEIAALTHDDMGLVPEEVEFRYRSCRFDLELGTGRLADLVNSPQTIVASNCMRCEVAVAATNDTYETLHTLAIRGSSMEVLRSILEQRDQQVEGLLACEQACRETELKQSAFTLTVAYYADAMQSSEDPATWAAAPVEVPSLPDYAVVGKPVGQFPVATGDMEQ